MVQDTLDIAMSSAYVRVSNAVSGGVLVAQTRIPCARLVSTVLDLLGSRPSRPVTLLHFGRVVDSEFSVPDGAHVELTATTGDALTVEDREELVRDLSHACEVRGWCCHVFMRFSMAT